MGSGENEMSNGRAVESERRWSVCLIVMGVLGKRYLACARAGDRAPTYHPPALITAFLAEKNIKFYFRTKRRTRKNTDVS